MAWSERAATFNGFWMEPKLKWNCWAELFSGCPHTKGTGRMLCPLPSRLIQASLSPVTLPGRISASFLQMCLSPAVGDVWVIILFYISSYNSVFHSYATHKQPKWVGFISRKYGERMCRAPSLHQRLPFLRNYCAQRILLVPLLPRQTSQDPSHKRDPCQYHINKRLATKALKTFACSLVHVQTLYAVGRRLEVTELENAMKECCVTEIPTSADAGRQETCWSRWQGLPRKAFDIYYGFSG